MDDERRMELLYFVLEQLAVYSIPVVIRGNVLLDSVMYHNKYNKTVRFTRDIDFDWVGDSFNREEFIKILCKIVVSSGLSDFTIGIKREEKEDQTLGLTVKEKGLKVFDVDVSLNFNYEDMRYTRIYCTPGGVKFTGISLDVVYADKVEVLSNRTILRRVKDFYDLYRMSFINEYNLEIIKEIVDRRRDKMGDFYEFREVINNIRHAYSKFKGVYNKPEFDGVYTRVRDFCMPSLIGQYSRAYWDPDTCFWCFKR